MNRFFKKKLLSATCLNVENAENLFSIEHSKEKLLFYFRTLIRAIDALLEKKYSEFDGHTTANCCHGMSVWVHELISSLDGIDLKLIQIEGKEKIESLEKTECQQTWFVPESLIFLARMHILHVAKKVDPKRGTLTCKTNLKTIAPVATRFCNNLVDAIQRHTANTIAQRYALLLKKLPQQMQMHGISLATWGKYISSRYLRIDQRGVKYAASMFSMRISLAHLISTKSKVAVINDVMDFSGNLKTRHVSLFEGDGVNHLRPLNRDELTALTPQSKEPVVVFGGCSYSKDGDENSIIFKMDPWLDQITSLLLACDAWYPHFPKVSDDPNFDSSAITPDEESLQRTINEHSKIPGVSAKNPDLFCLAHIYVASLEQVLEVQENKNWGCVPCSFIPAVQV